MCRIIYRWIVVCNCLLCDKPVMYIATPCQQHTVADVDRTNCAEGRHGSCCVWCWAMCSGKSYGCHLYGTKNRKACVLDIDMELPSVMSCRVLCRYVDTVCGVWYLPILSIFGVFVINLISFFGFLIYLMFLITIHFTS